MLTTVVLAETFRAPDRFFWWGGIVHGALSVVNSKFNGNIASALGGGIHATSLNGGDSNITDSTFDDNGSDAGGGLAVSNLNSVMRVLNCKFRGNSSTLLNARGGGIYHYTGNLQLVSSTLTGNENFGIEVKVDSGNTTAKSSTAPSAVIHEEESSLTSHRLPWEQ